MDLPLAKAFTRQDVLQSTEPEHIGQGADVQQLYYQSVSLHELPRDNAVKFCKQLFHPEERFSLSFYRYWREVLNMPEEEAWQATLDELKMYLDNLLANMDDPYFHTIGFNQHNEYIPIGLYGFRALEKHAIGPKLMQTLAKPELAGRYEGNLAIAHSFSALNGYRNRLLMKYAFLMIALEALQNDYQHIFFFMSDYKLGPIYQRFGMEFPEDLKLPDSQHLVGSYSITPDNIAIIQQVADQFKIRDSVPC